MSCFLFWGKKTTTGSTLIIHHWSQERHESICYQAITEGQICASSTEWVICQNTHTTTINVENFIDGKAMFSVQVVMRKTALPISLLNETAKNTRVHILDTEPYSSVFGQKKTRKRPSLKVSASQGCVVCSPSVTGTYLRKFFFAQVHTFDKAFLWVVCISRSFITPVVVWPF